MPRAARMIVLLLVAVLVGTALWFVASDGGGVTVPGPPERTADGAPERPDLEPPVTNGAAGPEAGPDAVRETADAAGGRPAGAEDAPADVVAGTGRVVDDRGAPVAGAAVRALLHRQAFVTVHEPLGVAALTDGTGAFRLEGLPAAAAVALAVEKDGFARATVGPIQTAREGAFPLPTVTLGPGLALVGTVRAEPDLRPVAEARVTVSPDRPEAGRMLVPGASGVGALTGTTGAAGRFTIPGLDFTHYRIEATAEGFAPAVVRRSFIASRGRDEVEVSLTLSPADAALRGVVVARDQPVGGALVRAVLRPGGADAHSTSTRAAPDGTFELQGLTRAPYDVTAVAPGHFSREPVVATPGGGKLRIELGRSGTLTGRVVLPGGAPPPSFTARLLRVEGRTGATRPVKRAVAGETPGAFRVTDVAPGRYVVEVDSPAAARTRSGPIEVGEGEDVEDVVVPLAAGGSVAGRLVDAEGRAVADATVLLVPGDFDPSSAAAELVQLAPHLDRSARSRADGRFALDHVAPGTVGLRVLLEDGGGALRSGVAVEPGEETDVGEVEVAAPGRLVGVALDVEGEPLPRGRVIAVSGETGTRRSGLTDPDGRFVLGQLPSGTYEVSIEAADLWRSFEFTSDTAATVPPGGTAEITVRVRRR